MMKSFLEKDGKKLIITDSVSGVNKLVRTHSAGKTIYGVKVVSISQLAMELFLAHAAIYEADKNYKIIDGNMQSMRMTAVLKNSDISFLTHETKTISSANEILSILNQIRTYAPSDFFLSSDANGERIPELVQLLDTYEKALGDNSELDTVMVLQKAIKLLQLAKEKPNAPVFLGILSADLNGNAVGGYFTEELSDLEKEFMDMLSGILGDTYTKIGTENQANYTYSFFKAYGIPNEVKHIKETIVSEKMPFGEVAIIYPNEAYEHFLMAEFNKEGIKFSFPRGFRAQAGDYVSFLIDLLDFASSDFEYKRLYKILQNPVIQIKKSRTAYRVFLKQGIGYGRDRYLSFFQYYESMPEKETIKSEDYAAFYQFLVDVIRCFTPEHTCEVIFRDLVKLAGTYTDHQDYYRACVKDDLQTYANALSIWDGNEFAEKLFQMDMFLKKLKCRTSESADAVSILPYGKTEIIDRKYIFAVGLSNENISTPNAESPVLCDAELKNCVNGNVQLAMERNKRMKDAFMGTLNLSMQTKVYLSYSYYDTVSIISNSPSLLFQQLLEDNGIEEQDIPCLGYEVCKESLALKNPVMQMVTESDNTCLQADKKDHTKCYKNFSASSLQNLIHCPMSYYYEKIRRIPQINFQERTPDSWLPANIKGNVFHHVMEKYVNEVIISQGKAAKDDRALMTIFEKEMEDCVKSTPVSSQSTFETEREECLEVLNRYVTELHDELRNASNKKVIGCEVSFEDISYIGKIEKDGMTKDAYELLLRGSVDRLDGVIDENGTLKLQIYDYKTGSISKKEEEIESGNQIQHHIYAIAMEEWAQKHKQELEQVFGQSIQKIVFDDARYVFPYEDEKREIRAACEFDEKSGKPVLTEGTNTILLCIVANYQNGNHELAIHISSEISKTLAQKDEKHCRYCNYTDVCRVCRK